MIETAARVTRIEGDTAWVVPESPGQCGACGGKGCGASLFSRMLRPEEPEYPVVNAIAARPGDAVVVGLAEGALLRAAGLGYLAPLAFLFAGTLLGAPFGEAMAALGAGLGLALAVFWLRRRRAPPAPVLLRHGMPAGCRAG